MAFKRSSVRTRLAPQVFNLYMYYVYILFRPSANIFYTGSTNNLERRISQHNAGYSKSTKRGIPWKLCYSEEYCDRSSAMKRESEIKVTFISRD